MEKLNKAISVLKKGGVVIVPTDTVYGFIADAGNKKAVKKIYKIKKRPKAKPLPVFVSSIKMARQLAEIDASQFKILRKYWPGKYTFILSRNLPDVGRRVLYGQDKKTIALRIPNHAFLQKLLKKVNRPLVQTSVNISTQEPLKTAEQIMTTFGENRLVGLIITVDKPLKSKSSKIIDLTT
ncbi:MAG: threonylcarbamoyl-AMP synthase [Candidatus Staskawiczbacteria bacterium RIFCSPHIGHO2_02_FULL_43_16]|uniref:L-threonylcarbamoyladenylate synthase n=1 Tax=Candidatus Staskawiczbacteria bacterium RIFCSPHIGHO2_01_FULL_41_41 TaxID=1802203 RepID=A0A1G2HTN4_9BACT|nr:MAG: threonylcarbamoyl-AMP synthase [Candidatus Staskawiczbacteria bacterium RIFCSPHIGHO2_01_FULL_41_41]OGZ68071.1 MAG: threonylcarbamoyl-AMP synthase [Candidatus Staskawiczbacteria bacterium RIFCSPHIGHO2_02_FULL_43_16]OGZ74809.1 MAG: threonylcarbamoyl-AMP synthase [Candidatus Staskawiczbacteria bacterium RIFCSPLOWO2_01_FULL_43_17b]